MKFRATCVLIALTLLMFPTAAFAQQNVIQGGTGINSVPYQTIPVGYTQFKLQATTTLNLTSVNATGSTSTINRFSVASAMNLLGDYITNVATWFTGRADSWFATKSTSNLTEGVNLYYTDARVLSYLNTLTKSFFFSTTSTDYWKTQNNFYSTTSTAYDLSTYPKGYFFSTTSVAYWESTQNRWATTSADYWLTTKNISAFSTTSANYWASLGLAFSTTSTNYLLNSTTSTGFSTTSANFWRSIGLSFSTTSADAWGASKGYLTANQTVTLAGDVTGSGATAITASFALGNTHWWTATQNTTNASTSQLTATSTVWLTSLATAAGTFLAVDPNGKVIPTTTPSVSATFSTTSASYFSSVGLAFSTTSNDYWLTQRNFYSTTSADYWLTQRNFYSTTSANYWASVGLAHSTTSVAYQLSQALILGPATSTSFAATNITATGTASTTNLTVSSVRSSLGLFGASGILGAYGGSSGVCTSQFPTSISASGVLGGCTSVTDAFVSGQIGTAHGGTGTDLSGSTGILVVNSGAVSASSTLAVLRGGTGSTTLTGLLKGNTTGGVLTAVPGTDYLAPSSLSASYPILYNSGTGAFSYLGLATTVPWTAGQIAMVVNGNTVGGVSTTTGGCTGTVSCPGFTILGSSPITITGSSGTAASSTLLSDINNFTGKNTFSEATSTRLNASFFTFTNASGSAATTTNFMSLFGNITFASTSALTVSGTGYFSTASTSNLTVSNVQNSLLNTSNTGVVQSTSFSGPLSFNAGTLTISQATAGANGYLSSTDWQRFNAALSTTTVLQIGNGQFFSTTSASFFTSVGLAFSTTSSNFWSSVGFGHSTTSVAYQLSQNITLGNATSTTLFSTTASTTNLYGTSINGFSLVTCNTAGVSALTWSGGTFGCNTISAGSGFSTTSADYWKTQRDFFSTTSASFFSSVGLAFSTTSNDYWQTQRNFFSTTSADYLQTQRNYFSTTSASYFSSVGLAFSTTSANFWSSVGLGHSTTSVAYQLSQNVTLGNATSTAFFATTASTTNFFVNAEKAGSSTIGVLTTIGTTTGANGFNISAGCFAVNGTCLSTSGGASAANTQIVYGTGSGITSSANVTYDGTTFQISGSGTNNTFKVIGSSAVSSGLYFQNTQTTGQAVMYVDNDRGSFASYGGLLDGGSANATGNLFGLSRADHVFLFADGANTTGLTIGTLTAQPLTLGTNNAEWMRIVANGRVGIGSTSPWGILSVSSSSISAAGLPAFAISTSSNPFGFLTGLWATTSTMVSGQNPRGFVLDSGARFAIGTTQTYDFPGLLDQLTVNGRISTGDWVTEQCNGVMNNGGGGITTALNPVCGQWGFRVDTNGSLAPTGNVTQNGGIGKMRLCASTLNTGSCSPALVANVLGSGSGLFYPNLINNFLSFSTSTPVFEAIFEHGSETTAGATSTSMYLGFVNTAPNGTSFEVEPTAGCYIAATSTTGANWQAICRTSAANVTTVDTGFASTTIPVGTTGNGNALRLRIEGDNSSARFYMATSGASMRLVAKITTNLPTAQSLSITAAAIIANTAAGTAGHGLWIDRIKVSYFQPALNY